MLNHRGVGPRRCVGRLFELRRLPIVFPLPIILIIFPPIVLIFRITDLISPVSRLPFSRCLLGRSGVAMFGGVSASLV